MGKQTHSRLHKRLRGLARVVRKKLDEADCPGKQMSKRERADLSHILSVMNTMLMEDRTQEDGRDKKETEREAEMSCRNSSQYLNTQCEFFDLDANRIQCAIGCDMYHCSKKCIYATNVPGTLPPYNTKYMKGWLEG